MEKGRRALSKNDAWCLLPPPDHAAHGILFPAIASTPIPPALHVYFCSQKVCPLHLPTQCRHASKPPQMCARSFGLWVIIHNIIRSLLSAACLLYAISISRDANSLWEFSIYTVGMFVGRRRQIQPLQFHSKVLHYICTGALGSRIKDTNHSKIRSSLVQLASHKSTSHSLRVIPCRQRYKQIPKKPADSITSLEGRLL